MKKKDMRVGQCVAYQRGRSEGSPYFRAYIIALDGYGAIQNASLSYRGPRIVPLPSTYGTTEGVALAIDWMGRWDPAIVPSSHIKGDYDTFVENTERTRAQIVSERHEGEKRRAAHSARNQARWALIEPRLKAVEKRYYRIDGENYEDFTVQVPGSVLEKLLGLE